jgi:DNA-binding response OmpR family regulator
MIEGASGYVVRPCGPRALLRSLKTAVKRHQLSRTLTCHPSPRAPHNLPCHSDPEPRKEEESPNFPST